MTGLISTETAVDPEAVDPEAVDPEAVDPEAVDPEAVDPEAVDPEAVDPEAVDLEAVDPEAVDLEAALFVADLDAPAVLDVGRADNSTQPTITNNAILAIKKSLLFSIITTSCQILAYNKFQPEIISKSTGSKKRQDQQLSPRKENFHKKFCPQKVLSTFL